MKYIDAEKLYEYLEQVSEFYPRYADNFLDNAVINVINGIKTFIASLQQEQPETIGGVVHHALNGHWLVVNKKKLSARLKQFPEGTEVEILINTRKEETK